MSLIKSPQDIQLLRQAGEKLSDVLLMASAMAQPGVSLRTIDAAIYKAIIEAEAKPSFLGFEGFPNSSCLSLNDEVVHGIPDDRILKEGDILGIDAGLWYKNVCVDAARTVGVGDINPESQSLLDVTQAALQAGIKAIKPFRRVGVISHAIQEVADHHNLGIVRGLTGHGVGHHVHEEPEVPNYGKVNDGILLRPGMVLAIEPMLTLGKGDIFTAIDGWAIITADHSLSAQFEHTVIITNKGAEIVV